MGRLLFLAVAVVCCVFSHAATDCLCPSSAPSEPFLLEQAERTLLLGHLKQGRFDTALALLEQSHWRTNEFHRQLHSLLVQYKTFQQEWHQQNQQALRKLQEQIRSLRSDPNQAASLGPDEILLLLIRSQKDNTNTAALMNDPWAVSLTQQLRRKILHWQSQGEYEKAWRSGLRTLLQADPNNPDLLQQKADLLSKIDIEKKLTIPLCPGQSEPYADVQADRFYDAIRLLEKKYLTALDYPALSRRALACAQHISEVLATQRKDFLYQSDPNALTAWNQHLKTLRQTEETAPGKTLDIDEFLDQIRRLLELNRSTLRLPEGLVVQLLAKTVLEELDPYTEIVWPDRREEFDKQMSGEFAGVGIRISRQDNLLKIVDVVPGSPAEESGLLQPDDIILAIEGTPTQNLSLDCAVRLISGPQGTSVTLTIGRQDQESPVTLLRRKIVLPSLHGNTSGLEQPLKTREDRSAYRIDPDPSIAYLRLSGFRKDTPQLLRRTLEDLQASGLRGLILDLRSNSGGLLDAAVSAADLFLSKGTLVHTCNREGPEQEIPASPDALLPQTPLVVLVDGGTASGAEILAGALANPADHRAVLVGSRTYGKSTIQEVESLHKNGTQLKYTRGYFLLSDGRAVPNRYQQLKQNRTDWGLRPNVEVETSEPQLEKNKQAKRNLEHFFNENKGKKPEDIQPQLIPLLDSLVRSDPPLAAGLTILKAQILASSIPYNTQTDPNPPSHPTLEATQNP